MCQILIFIIPHMQVTQQLWTNLSIVADLVKQSAQLTPKSNVNRYECSGHQKTNDDTVIKLAKINYCMQPIWMLSLLVVNLYSCLCIISASSSYEHCASLDFLRPWIHNLTSRLLGHEVLLPIHFNNLAHVYAVDALCVLFLTGCPMPKSLVQNTKRVWLCWSLLMMTFQYLENSRTILSPHCRDNSRRVWY